MFCLLLQPDEFRKRVFRESEMGEHHGLPRPESEVPAHQAGDGGQRDAGIKSAWGLRLV